MESSNYKLDLSYLNEVGSNKIEFIRNMLSHFSKQLPELLSDIDEAFKVNDYKTIELRAHEAKNITAYVNDHGLSEKFIAIEKLAYDHEINDNTYVEFTLIVKECTVLLDAINSYLDN